MNPVDKLVCISCKRNIPRPKSVKMPNRLKTCPWCRKPVAARQSNRSMRNAGR